MCKHVWSQKLSERSRKKGGRTWPERCLERTTKGGEKERMLDVGPCLVPCSIYKHPLSISLHSSVCCRTQRTFSKTPRLCRSVTSQPFLPPPAPTSLLVLPSHYASHRICTSSIDEKIGVPGRASWLGEGVG